MKLKCTSIVVYHDFVSSIAMLNFDFIFHVPAPQHYNSHNHNNNNIIITIIITIIIIFFVPI